MIDIIFSMYCNYYGYHFRDNKDKAKEQEEVKGQNTVMTKRDHLRNAKFALSVGDITPLIQSNTIVIVIKLKK